MKKLFGILLATVAAVTLAACDNGFKKDPNTYYTSISDTTNINPYSETLNNASTLYDLVSAGLYRGDIDWAASGKTVGDFSDSANLVYARVPYLADAAPVAVDGTTNPDTDNPDAALEAKTWKIKLRSGITFEDGTPITATTYVQSWKRLLDPKLLNDRAVNLYDTSYVGIVGAESYFSQGKSVTDASGRPVYADEANKDNADIENPDKLGFVYLAEKKVEGAVVREAGWYPQTIPAADAVTANKVAFGTEDAFTLADQAKTVVKAPAGKVKRTYKAFDWSGVQVSAVDNDSTIQFTLRTTKSLWDVKGSFTSAVTGVVHLEKFDAGMSTDGTRTTYGTAENPLISYGPYKLTTWEKGVVFEFSKNDKFHDKDAYRIEKIRYSVLTDQKTTVNEFEAGRLDVAGVGGSYFEKYASHPTLKRTPDSATFRFAFNAEREINGKKTAASINDFRRAFYFAVNRTELANGSAAPANPTNTLLNDQYYTSEFSTVKYRDTAAGRLVSSTLANATNGYSPSEAKRLFDLAYAEAVTQGIVQDGQALKLEYLVLQADSNIAIANQVKESVINAFQANAGQANAGKFEFIVTALETDAMDAKAKAGEFDIMFRAWSGLDFDAVSLLAQVYNNKYAYMNEKGFTTGDKLLTFKLSDKAITKIAAAKAGEDAEDYVGITVSGNNVTASLHDAFNLLEYDILYSEYSDRALDLSEIAGAMEKFLLVDEVIAIPLFGRIGATAYSSRVQFDFNAYHSWLGWGGLRYMSLTTAK